MVREYPPGSAPRRPPSRRATQAVADRAGPPPPADHPLPHPGAGQRPPPGHTHYLRHWLRGKKTLTLAAVVAFGPGASEIVAGVDWGQLGLSPKWTLAIGTSFALLRLATHTPVRGLRREPPAG